MYYVKIFWSGETGDIQTWLNELRESGFGTRVESMAGVLNKVVVVVSKWKLREMQASLPGDVSQPEIYTEPAIQVEDGS